MVKANYLPGKIARPGNASNQQKKLNACQIECCIVFLTTAGARSILMP